VRDRSGNLLLGECGEELFESLSSESEQLRLRDRHRVRGVR
jgi:hypothetical protein